MNGAKKESITSYKRDVGVGKTCITQRFIKDDVSKSVAPTVGVEFSTRTETLADGTRVKAQVWDTAGQERYRSVTSAHFRKAMGALLVYDITKESSFLSVGRWAEELKYHAGNDINIMLVGNKLDEAKGRRAVPRDEAERYAAKHQMKFQEVSAMSGDFVKEAFLELLEEVHRNWKNKKQDEPEIIRMTKQMQAESGGCAC